MSLYDRSTLYMSASCDFTMTQWRMVKTIGQAAEVRDLITPPRTRMPLKPVARTKTPLICSVPAAAVPLPHPNRGGCEGRAPAGVRRWKRGPHGGAVRKAPTGHGARAADPLPWCLAHCAAIAACRIVGRLGWPPSEKGSLLGTSTRGANKRHVDSRPQLALIVVAPIELAAGVLTGLARDPASGAALLQLAQASPLRSLAPLPLDMPHAWA